MLSKSSERQGFARVVVDHENLSVENHVVAVFKSFWNEVLKMRHLVSQNRFETSREIFEVVALFVKLNTFAVVFYFYRKNMNKFLCHFGLRH